MNVEWKKGDTAEFIKNIYEGNKKMISKGTQVTIIEEQKTDGFHAVRVRFRSGVVRWVLHKVLRKI